VAKRKSAPPKRRRANRRSRGDEAASPDGGGSGADSPARFRSRLRRARGPRRRARVGALRRQRLGRGEEGPRDRRRRRARGDRTPIVLWTDPGGYNAYAQRCFFDPEQILPTTPAPGANTPERIGRRSSKAPLRETITSSSCTTTWRSTRAAAFARSRIGGASRSTSSATWTARSTRPATSPRSAGTRARRTTAPSASRSRTRARSRDEGPRRALQARRPGALPRAPASLGASPFRTAGFTPRPARKVPICGTIHGRVQTMWDYTRRSTRPSPTLRLGSRACSRGSSLTHRAMSGAQCWPYVYGFFAKSCVRRRSRPPSSNNRQA